MGARACPVISLQMFQSSMQERSSSALAKPVSRFRVSTKERRLKVYKRSECYRILACFDLSEERRSTNQKSDTESLLSAALWIQELITVVEKRRRILFCRLLVMFFSQIKNISHGTAFTGIVLDIDRRFFVICKQNDEKMQCIKHGVSIGHVCQRNTHDECERTQVKHNYSLRNKI